jgi:hypothetical protein
MKLSEAIRIGSEAHPRQGFGRLERVRRRYFFGLIGPIEREVCALGAAFAAGGCATIEAINDGGRGFRGGTQEPGSVARIVDTPPEWTRLLHMSVVCPQCGLTDPLFRVVPHMNDDHRWKREDIAFFVEGVEKVSEQNRAATARWLDEDDEDGALALTAATPDGQTKSI